MDRQIWEDVIREYDTLRDSDEFKLIDVASRGSPADPRAEIVGDAYSSACERIEIEEIDWDSMRIEYDGVAPLERLERVSEDDIAQDWSEFQFEPCAWYQSYHYAPRKFWGIHIKESCWDETARKLYRSNQYKTWPDALKGAFFEIFLHEFFHYIADLASTVLEIVKRNPYIYTEYSSKVYSKVFLTKNCTEEALANRYMYGRADTMHLDRDYLYQSLKIEPPGYRDFVDFTGSRFWVGRRILMNQIHDSVAVPGVYGGLANPKPIEQIMEILSPWEYSHGHRVPLWLHRPPKGPYRIFVK